MIFITQESEIQSDKTKTCPPQYRSFWSRSLPVILTTASRHGTVAKLLLILMLTMLQSELKMRGGFMA